MDWIGGAGLAVAVFALVIQWHSNRRALEAQATESREGRQHAEKLALAEHESALAMAREERLWTRRADLYTRMLEAVRSRVEDPGAVKSERPEDDSNLTSLAAEAYVLASSEVQDDFNRFVYDNVDREDQVDIWAELQIAVKRELGIPRD
ncbi:hypothetical protein OG555_18975 [Kribbella sp. NBC_01484]|uniref:hypothetical protein n=1 Tax=Kribbella sp. NBC_01484 TaxID=2903579 RepID=UPI002E2EB767|nr:hypothetical protein [Kribbella sp. NBC_01484]